MLKFGGRCGGRPRAHGAPGTRTPGTLTAEAEIAEFAQSHRGFAEHLLEIRDPEGSVGRYRALSSAPRAPRPRTHLLRCSRDMAARPRAAAPAGNARGEREAPPASHRPAPPRPAQPTPPRSLPGRRDAAVSPARVPCPVPSLPRTSCPVSRCPRPGAARAPPGAAGRSERSGPAGVSEGERGASGASAPAGGSDGGVC